MMKKEGLFKSNIYLKLWQIKALWLIFGFISVETWAQNTVNIIPAPVSLTTTTGHFTIDPKTSINFNPNQTELKASAEFLKKCISAISGYQLPFNSSGPSIKLQLIKNAELGNEGYLLSVKSSGITISANEKAGIVYGVQTLLQTLPAIRTNAVLSVPGMDVKDYPRFKWRGMHLDVSRHFFSADLVKDYISLMATYKMNTFHWHLVDDQGWRIEIKKYPLLTSVGAWRVDNTGLPWASRPQAKPGEPATYGGYYTQDQIKEIIAFAAERNITIVPEIEMPGHVASAIAAYPKLSCTQKPQLPLTGGDYTNMSSNYCAGNDAVFSFLQDVLTEVMNLFPSKYIHIGGDEVDKRPWENCPRCQARIKKEKLHNEEELQSYFIKRIEKFVIGKNRKMIGWDEILEGGLAPEATVMSWRGEKGGIEAAKMNHDVVMTPGDPLYFDKYQAGPDGEPLAIGGMNTLRNVYEYDPIPKELPADKATYILGAQANLWAEYITTPQHVLYMVLPRMLALSEVVWSPASQKNWISFNKRLKNQYKKFDQLQYRYSLGSDKVLIKPESGNGRIEITLSGEALGCDIFYTLDGTNPTTSSNKYQKPFLIEQSSTIRAATACEGKVSEGIPSKLDIALHKASGKKVVYKVQPSATYMANGMNSLTDGVRGDFTVTRYWHGFNGSDMVATVDLEKSTDINQIALGCLQNYDDWIFMPQWVKFEVSTDGVNYKELGVDKNSISPTDKNKALHTFSIDAKNVKARYVRVTAKIIDACPPGHSGAGKPGWLFVDELLVK